MKYSQIPVNTFKNLVMNAGILATTFDPSTETISGQLGATSGGIKVDLKPTYIDYGTDIDNCPKNTKELKKLDNWECKISGTFTSCDGALAKKLLAAADLASNKITPRMELKDADFSDIWLVGDYSDVNEDASTTQKAGFIAVKLLNALSTGGLSIQTKDKGKGTFAFEFTGHQSTASISTPPFEVYIKTGTKPA